MEKREMYELKYCPFHERVQGSSGQIVICTRGNSKVNKQNAPAYSHDFTSLSLSKQKLSAVS